MLGEEVAVSIEAPRRNSRHGMGWVVGRILLEVTQRMRGSRTLHLLRKIESSPFVPRAEARARQFHSLSALIAHAEAHVPYYREVFRSLGIRSRDIRSLADFSRLPVLTKDIVRERLRDLVRDDVPLKTLSLHHSGGSTGVPLTFYRDRGYMDASDAGGYRNFRQAGWHPGEPIAFFWGGNERLYRMPRWEFELRQRMRRMYQFDPFDSGRSTMERWIGTWNRLQPRIAFGYASTLARFAEFLDLTHRTVPPLAGAFTTAEKLYQPQRELIGRVFQCRVYDCYGSAEVQNIAAECPHGRMHVNSDFVVLEADSIPHSTGPLPFLVTSLWNYAMPFIRYRNEDCGALVEGDCTCGNHFPLMHLNIARVSDNFTLGNGRVVHGEYFTHLLYGSEGIANFQFHQVAPDRIVLWIVPLPGDGAKKADATQRALDQVRALAPGRIEVEVREVSEIPLSSAGKHRFTRSDVKSINS